MCSLTGGRELRNKLNKQNLLNLKCQVDVDVLKPAMNTIKDTSREIWDNTPEPVRIAAPYVCVATGAAIVVNFFNQRTIALERAKYKGLKDDYDLLLKVKNELDQDNRRLERQAGLALDEMVVSKAMSEVTIAAAAAATSAAEMAKACSIQFTQKKK
eukprot:TRINITY_DN40586_c0_g3_i1.p2 TRINITY_DN40586_c0_g3~~TRINITY_DN40586_c0_g3_i1.p2  ORF type:complete len:157 (-),score=23.36 TRINITY_DN40586_c0_g3_i1:161-631(-)